MSFSISEAASRLGVTPRTMKAWLRLAGINTDGGSDHRERIITVEQLVQIGALHRRPVIVHDADLTLDSLAAHVQMIEQRLRMLQQKVDHPRRDLADRVLRNTHENQNLLPQMAPPAPPVDVVQIVVRQAIALLDEAPEAPTSQAEEILITFQGENDIFDLVPSLRGAWRLAIERAMRRGWHVTHLIRTTGDSDDYERAMTVADDMTQLLRGPRGAYLPLLTPPRITPSAKLREYVAAPGVGMLELKASRAQHIDTLIRHEPGEKFDQRYAKLLRLRARSKPAVIPYPALSIQFSRRVVEAESGDGDRYLIMAGLSELTVPLDIHAERTQGILDQDLPEETHDKARAALKVRTDRHEGFKREIQRWRYFDICPLQAIRDYLGSGVIASDDLLSALGAPNLTPTQMAFHLTQLIERLRKYPNYELGLVEDELDPSLYKSFWLVKTGKVVLLECPSSQGAPGAEEEIDLAVEEPQIVKAFRERFLQYWAQLKPLHRDKDWVINWLSDRRDEI